MGHSWDIGEGYADSRVWEKTRHGRELQVFQSCLLTKMGVRCRERQESQPTVQRTTHDQMCVFGDKRGRKNRLERQQE